MERFVKFIKLVLGILLLLAWVDLTVLFAAAAFGSYFDHSSMGLAVFLGPLLTGGRHLLQSLSSSYAPTKVTVVADLGTDVLLTAAVISFLTHFALGVYVDSPYFGYGVALTMAAIGVQVLAHLMKRKA